jgi:aspartate racemase
VTESVIGILGGMGPEATVELYRRIVHYTDAKTDQDHLRAIIDSNPKIPDRNAHILYGGEDPTQQLCETARNLERAGADFIVIPCNAAHMYLQRLRDSVGIPILSIVDEAVRSLVEGWPQVRSVGLMTSTAVRQTRLYADPLEKRGIRTLLPGASDQQLLLDSFFAVKAGDKSPELKARLRRVGEDLISMGAEALIFACTELSVVLGPEDFDVPVVDALEALARAAIREARAALT